MNKYVASIANERGSALLVMVILVPVLTLFCLFASNIGYQNQMVTTNDRCHRDGFYDSDGAVYGTSKLISLIEKNKYRAAVQSGVGNDAPGIDYISTGGNASDFVTQITEGRLNDTDQDVQFKKPNPADDFGIESTVDIIKFPAGNPAGGGAEFGNSAGGIGEQLVVVIFRLQSSGQSACPNTPAVQVQADYWMIATEAGQTKGI
jgi:hypothetical protein